MQFNTEEFGLVINRAVCHYREAKAQESRVLFSKACKARQASNNQGDKQSDLSFIMLDKAIRAAEESHAAHASLGVKFANPEDCMTASMIEFWREELSTKAEEAYARAEAEVEARNNERDNELMYGAD
jgi:hypothetical protein